MVGMVIDVAVKRYCKNCNQVFYGDEIMNTESSTRYQKYCSKKCARQHKLAKKLKR